jgi:hypothetical protein
MTTRVYLRVFGRLDFDKRRINQFGHASCDLLRAWRAQRVTWSTTRDQIAYRAEKTTLRAEKAPHREETTTYRFTDACRAHHKHVLGQDFRSQQRWIDALPSPSVTQRNCNRSFGIALAHNVCIQILHDMTRC